MLANSFTVLYGSVLSVRFCRLSNKKETRDWKWQLAIGNWQLHFAPPWSILTIFSLSLKELKKSTCLNLQPVSKENRWNRTINSRLEILDDAKSYVESLRNSKFVNFDQKSKVEVKCVQESSQSAACRISCRHSPALIDSILFINWRGTIFFKITNAEKWKSWSCSVTIQRANRRGSLTHAASWNSPRPMIIVATLQIKTTVEKSTSVTRNNKRERKTSWDRLISRTFVFGAN